MAGKKSRPKKVCSFWKIALILRESTFFEIFVSDLKMFLVDPGQKGRAYYGKCAFYRCAYYGIRANYGCANYEWGQKT